MSESKNVFTPIPIESDHEDYLRLLLKSEFTDSSKSITHLNQQQYEKVIKALDKAHEIRKFEIELYWKRATYFWAFIAIVATAYGAYFYMLKSKSDILPLLLLAALGFILSICLYASIISSKSWQNNWEKSVDILEFYVTGNLYKININNGNLYKYSVSGINRFVSFIICLSWCFAFIYPVINESLSIKNGNTYNLNETPLLIFILLCILVFVFILIRKNNGSEIENTIKLRTVKIKKNI